MSYIGQFPGGSAFDAARMGNPELRDWDVVTHILAGIYDAVHFNTMATGWFEKGKRPDIPMLPRPKTKKQTEDEEAATTSGRSLADLFNSFTGGAKGIPPIRRKSKGESTPA